MGKKGLILMIKIAPSLLSADFLEQGEAQRPDAGGKEGDKTITNSIG